MQHLLSTDSFKFASSSVLKELAVNCDLTDLEEVMIFFIWTLIVTEILGGTFIYVYISICIYRYIHIYMPVDAYARLSAECSTEGLERSVIKDVWCQREI